MTDTRSATDGRSRLLAAKHRQRDPAPSNTWDYQAYGTWRDEIWNLLRPIVDNRVKDAFLAKAPEYVVSDDLSWLDRIVRSVRRHDVDSKGFLCEQLYERYDTLRALHGTRTADVASFYREGLRPLDALAAHQQAEKIFLGGDYPELSKAVLDQAIKSVRSPLREGRVFFEANERMLIEHCGHYMLYGSEYLTAIAAHLGGPRNYRQILKTRGSPTLFVCDVPLPLIPGHTLQEFAGIALATVFQELLDGPEFEPHPWHGAGFYIQKPLPPSSIIGHYHPVVRRDPFASGR